MQPRRSSVLFWVGTGLVAVGCALFAWLLVTRDDSAPKVASSSAAATAASPSVVSSSSGPTTLADFGHTAVTIVGQDGTSTTWCLLLAQTEAERERGLMQVTDPQLAGYDGMLFRFQTDTRVGFWMRNTPTPLTVGFFEANGSVRSTTDMAPCADSPNCRNYDPGGLYRSAIEVVQSQPQRAVLVGASRLIDTGETCSPRS